MAFDDVVSGSQAVADSVQQLIDAWTGVSGRGEAMLLTALSGSTFALTIRQRSGNHLKILKSTDASTLLTVTDSGFALGSAGIGVPAGSLPASLGLFISTDTNTGLYSSGADSLSIVTGGTAKLTANTSVVQSSLPISTSNLQLPYTSSPSPVGSTAVLYSKSTGTGVLHYMPAGGSEKTLANLEDAQTFSGVKTLTSPVIANYGYLSQSSTPSGGTLPASSQTTLYSKTDGKLYRYPNGGAETRIADYTETPSSVITTNGDTIYGTGSGVFTRLGIGSTNYSMHVVGGVPSWQPSPTSTLTTTGDTLYASSANTLARLAIGTTHYVKTVAGGVPTWTAGSKATLTTTGDTLYASSANTLARLGIGTARQLLRTNGSADAPEWFTPPHVRAYRTTAKSITSGAAPAAVEMDAERFDSDGMHSLSSNTERLTCITPGLYMIIAQGMFEANASGTRSVSIVHNSTTTIAFEWRPNNGTSTTAISASTLYRLSAADWIDMRVYQDSGGALNINSTGNYSPELMAVWMAP